MVSVVSTLWWSSVRWRVNLTSGESGEEEADGRSCGLVDIVSSLTYHSRSSANSGICS